MGSKGIVCWYAEGIGEGAGWRGKNIVCIRVGLGNAEEAEIWNTVNAQMGLRME